MIKLLWSKRILQTIDYWNTLAHIPVDTEDYEKAYEYFKRSIMFGDFEEISLGIGKIPSKIDVEVLKQSFKNEPTH